MMSALIIILISGFVAAAEPAPTSSAPATTAQDMPDYKNFSEPVYQTMEQKEQKPNTVNNSFSEAASKITSSVQKFLRTKRDELMKVQAEKKKEFELKAKQELKEWYEANPKKKADELIKTQRQKRQALMDQLSQERKQLELELSQKKSQFNDYMKTARQEFRQKYNSYVESMKLKAEPAEKSEFKEIPKGQGIKLSPVKDDAESK